MVFRAENVHCCSVIASSHLHPHLSPPPPRRLPGNAPVSAVTHGSIMTIHMPELGFREWDFRAMELILAELGRRGLRSVTLSELEAASRGGTRGASK